MATSPESHEFKLPVVRGFELQDLIGEGGFSKVYRAVDYKINMMAACKVVLLSRDTNKAMRKELHKEIKVHSQLRHTNILRFLGSLVIENDGQSEYVPAVYMLLELAGAGDLFDKIAPDYGVDDDLAHNYFRQLIEGLRFVHGIGVCHRDLKPENILLDTLGQLKLSDFGLCSVYKHKGQERTLTERCGSLPYVAPEIHNSNDPYRGEAVDVWGAGVILFTLLVGNTPWDEPSANSPEYSAFVTGRILNISPWDRIRGESLKMLLDCLTVDPNHRITFDEIVQHPWYQRSSQLPNQPGAVAERLNDALMRTGDMQISEPDFVELSQKADQDQIMMTATAGTQFTRTLMLFSQTQHGARYEPNLTRFYVQCPPLHLLESIVPVLTRNGMKYKVKPETQSVKVGGLDRRQEKLVGVIQIEYFAWDGGEGSRCVMNRSTGNPMEWRRLWKTIVTSPEVQPYVLRRENA